jgi:predicted ATPase
MLRECAEAVEALTAVRPLVLVLEDLHWSDQATLALVAYLAQRRAPARLLLIGTYRPVDVIVHGHPLKAVKTALALRGQCVGLPLEGLPAAAVAAVVAARLPGPALPAAVVTTLHRRTDGHPLFLVQLVDTLRRQGVLVAAAGRWELPGGLAALEAVVPESLRQLIEQQFDGLRAEQQRVLEAASVVGQDWTVAAVAAGMDTDVEQVEAGCEELARQGQFVQAWELVAWPDGTVSGSYQFRHALYQQVVYDRVPVGQRVRLHRRLGARLEAGYQAQTSAHAAELALHFERGREPARAVHYLRQAGENALRRSAHREAVPLLTRGLALLAQLPETPARVQQELDLQLTLGPALMATKGQAAPEVEQTYARARALCAQVGETPQLLPTLWGLHRFYENRGTLPTARELGEQFLQLAQRTGDPTHRLEAYIALGSTLYYLGDYAAAWIHLEQGIALTTLVAQRALGLRRGLAPGVWCLGFAASTLWCLGSPAQALRRGQEALTLAQELTHPYSLAFAQHCAASVHQRRREAAAVQEYAAALLALATRQGFPLYRGFGLCWRGWALAAQGQGEAGLTQLRQGLETVVATGQTLSRPFCLVLLAEAAGQVGHVEEGLRLLAEAFAVREASGRGDVLPEAYRLQGEFLLRQAVPDVAQAEACFQQALALARHQQAKAWELRAAMSLARLWQRQGKWDDAHQVLASIYGWFTEGFDTADLHEAKTLLGELA